jgi:hypothetical protein
MPVNASQKARARHAACAVLWAALVFVAPPALAAPPSGAQQPAVLSAGETLYRFGRLPSGQPLRGERAGGASVTGVDAACMNCHRRSGLGSLEGRNFIPPITGQFLFHPKAQRLEDLDLPYVEGARPNREPYTEATLARALREGIGADGKPLSVLMPRYALDDASMAALSDYLKTLTAKSVPGVGDNVLQFATIITPDVDPVKRAAFLAVINDYFDEKNANARAVSPRLYSYRKERFRVTRRWQLHVWELAGPAETWEAQLRKHLAVEPVFAVISGLGGANWAPVHHFCEQAALPCLFPNVQLPVVAENDFHTLYFTKGVLLEAGLIGHQLQDRADGRPIHRLVQVYRTGDVGGAAARALAATARATGIEVVDRVLKGSGPEEAQLAAAINEAGSADGLVLWLRPNDLAALRAKPAAAAQVWISGLMAGLESAPLPAAWRSATLMAYPVDLPDKRRVRVDYPLGWFRIRHIPVTDVQLQADTYLACGLLSETLKGMVDTFVRDYLIERIEGMLEHRVITGYYPRLALAPGQRFASKGGYLVRFAGDSGTKLVAASEWIVP